MKLLPKKNRWWNETKCAKNCHKILFTSILRLKCEFLFLNFEKKEKREKKLSNGIRLILFLYLQFIERDQCVCEL